MEVQKKADELISMIRSFQKENELANHDYKQLIKLFKDSAFRLYTDKSHQAVAVFNFLEGRYDYLSNSIAEFCPQFDPSNPESGADLFISMMKPSSIEAMIKKMTPRMLQTCQEYKSEVCNLRFTACVEINPTQANISWAMMHSYMLSATPEGFPILSCTLVTDVTGIKKDPFLHYSGHVIRNSIPEVVYYETMGGETPAGISKREIEVLQLVAKGFTTKQIAEKLFVSYETAKKHRSNILEKMTCTNTGELLNKATVMGLV
jgi:DNA-binding CsgD family transcriptional regulator